MTTLTKFVRFSLGVRRKIVYTKHMDKNTNTHALISKLKINKVRYSGRLSKPKGELNLIYYLSGKHTVTINGVSKKLTEDDITATSDSDEQAYVSDSGEIIVLECDSIFLLQFKTIYQNYTFDSFLQNKQDNKRVLHNFEELLKIGSGNYGLLTSNDYTSMGPLLAANAFLRGKENHDEAEFILLQISHINNILYVIKEMYGFYSKTPDVLQQIREYIHNNFTSNIKRSEIATRFGYNEYYFSVFFKKRFGINFQEYVNSLRYNYVKQRLSFNTSNESKTNIILSSGFNNAFSYYRYAKMKEKTNL